MAPKKSHTYTFNSVPTVILTQLEYQFSNASFFAPLLVTSGTNSPNNECIFPFQYYTVFHVHVTMYIHI